MVKLTAILKTAKELLRKFAYKKLMKKGWMKYTVCSLTSLIIIAVIFAFPVKPVSVEMTKPYAVNEMRYEPYSTIDYVISQESVHRNRTIADGYYTVLPFGVTVPFQINESGARLTGEFENTIPGSFVVYNSVNHIVWELLNSSRDTIDLALPLGEYRAQFRENVMWGEQLYLNLNIEWDEKEEVARYQEVIKFREVPIVVTEETKVVTTSKLSIWQILFD